MVSNQINLELMVSKAQNLLVSTVTGLVQAAHLATAGLVGTNADAC